MKKFLICILASLPALCCEAQNTLQTGGIYTCRSTDDIVTYAFDDMWLLYDMFVVSETNSLAAAGQMESDAAKSVAGAMTEIGFQFNTDSCNIVYRTDTDEWGAPLFGGMTCAYNVSNDTVRISVAGSSDIVFVLKEGAAKVEVQSDFFEKTGFCQQRQMQTVFGGDAVSVWAAYTYAPADLMHFIAYRPFAMRALAPRGNFVISSGTSVIQAYYPSVGLLDEMVRQTEGVAVIYIGNNEWCKPCDKFNALCMLPAVSDWLTRDGVAEKTLIAYLDASADMDRINHLGKLLGRALTASPAVLFVGSGGELAKEVVAYSDDGTQQLSASLFGAIKRLSE